MAWYDKFAPPPLPPNANNPTWYYKFAPKTTAPSDPQTAPVAEPAPKGLVTKMQTYEVILAYNNGLSNFAEGKLSWPPPDASPQVLGEGVKINRITQAQAMEISSRIKPCAFLIETQLPSVWGKGSALTYFLATLAIESTLDPNCQNANTGFNSAGVARSNPTNDPLGYDMGIAQLKLRYLVGVAKGCVDADTARAFALDVDMAIPYHCSIMGGKISWAQGVIEKNTSSTPDPRLSNPLLLATGAYNFGSTGMMTYYETGQFPSHCQHVINLETYFAQQLGLTSVFAGLSAPTP